MLGRHALYGYRSMIEFLPGRVLPAVRDAVLSHAAATAGCKEVLMANAN